MLRETIDDCKAALRCLTRLPVRGPQRSPEEALAASVPAFPLIGALIGALAALVFALASSLGLGPMLAAVLAVAAQALLTGGLHEDGLADMADGFGGGRTRADKLRIMRDPRLGRRLRSAAGISLCRQPVSERSRRPRRCDLTQRANGSMHGLDRCSS